MSLPPRVVVVERRTELAELVATHGTRGQAAFFLEQRGHSLTEIEDRHSSQQDALRIVAHAIPVEWRRARLERSDLAHFSFAPEDIVIVVGQDGLVANVAKYLDGQPVIGVNADTGRNPGVLVRHLPSEVTDLLTHFGAGRPPSIEFRTMVEARLDDGQRIAALNEVYVGHRSHQSARYDLAAPDGRRERQSSSGVLVGTGTGATGWCRSVWVERRSTLALPEPTAATLCWFVRESWPSPTTATTLTEGSLALGECLTLRAENDLVVFGDGIEPDAISVATSQSVTLAVSARTLHLVAPG